MSDEEEFEAPGADIGEVAPEEVEEGAPLWMATFGDMMSLLLVFFILMYSMSELKVERFLLASQSLNQAMGGTRADPIENPMGLMPDPVDPELALSNPGLNEGSQPDPGQGDSPDVADSEGGASEDWLDTFTDAYLEMIAKRLEAFVEEQELEDQVKVAREGEGVYLRIETVVLFRSGEAVIQPAGREVLDYLSLITTELDVPVSISGHADNVPIRTAQFPSNWELSAARAAGVARQLVSTGQEPTTVRVESYGEFRPVADNSTSEGRSANRRVELFYSREEIREAARRWATEGQLPGAVAESAAPAAAERVAG
jgi:chemotaxis protein MotB